MIKHTFLSLFRDLKDFVAIKKDRISAIENSSVADIKSEFGVNNLSKSLHPDELTLKVIENKKDRFGHFILFEEINKKELPLFKSGQFIVIKPSVFGIAFSKAVFLVDKKDKTYAIFSPDSKDSESEKLNLCKPGDIFSSTAPEGYAVFEPLRDSENIFVVCDKQGFGASQSFLSDKNLFTKTKVFTLFSDTIEIQNENSDLGVFLREAKQTDGTVFIYGADDFVNQVKDLCLKSGLSRKRIRYEIISFAKKREDNGKKYVCHVIHGDEKFDVLLYSHLTVSNSFELAGVPIKIKCMSGTCGYCRMKLVSGDIETDFPEEHSVRMADEKYGFIHPCRSYPKSDITVIL